MRRVQLGHLVPDVDVIMNPGSRKIGPALIALTNLIESRHGIEV